jgi:hypothetical protein
LQEINADTWLLHSRQTQQIAMILITAGPKPTIIRGFVKIKTNNTRADLVIPIRVTVVAGWFSFVVHH